MATKKAVNKKVPAKKTAVKNAKNNTAPAKKAAAEKPVKKAVAKKSPVKAVPVKKSAPVKKAAVKKKTTATPQIPVVSAAQLSGPNHIISKHEGGTMVTQFRNNMLSLNSKTNVHFADGREFHVSLFHKLLQLPGAEKLRFYNAVNNDNEHTLVITAADKKGNDIYFTGETIISAQQNMMRGAMPGDTDGVGDMGTQCPAYDTGLTAL
jgi:hypothetical protein